VVQALEEIALERRYPGRIVSTMDPRFGAWKMRDECLNVHWFADLAEAHSMIEE
jgi:hypothetical protein